MTFLQQNIQSKEYNRACFEHKFDSIMSPPPKKKKKNNNNKSLSWKAIQKKWTIKPAIWRRETFYCFYFKSCVTPCKHCLHMNSNTILMLCIYSTIYFTPHYATWNRERNFFCGRDWGHFCLSLLVLDLLLLLLLTFDALLDGIDKFTVHHFGSFIFVLFFTCLTWKKKRSQTLT